MKKPLLITLIIIILIIILLIMKKLLTLSTATSLAITNVVPYTSQAQETTSITNTQEKVIKHELARMPEQASWTIERWNINDVDFELKQLNRETNNQLAQFELEVEIPNKSKKSKAKLNPVANFMQKGQISLQDISKNKIIYKSINKQFSQKSSSTKTFWNILDYQLMLVEGGQSLIPVRNKQKDYINYIQSSFPRLAKLVDKNNFKGEVLYKGQKYLIYQSEYQAALKDIYFKDIEFQFNFDRSPQGDDAIDYEKLATLPTIEDLFKNKFYYTVVLNKNTRLPIYYSDCISLRKYNLDFEYEAIEVPEIIQKNVKWYIENVLPEMERKKQKLAN